MKKDFFLIGCLLFVVLCLSALEAQTTSYVNIDKLIPETGLEFHSVVNGLMLSASFPESASDMKSLTMTLKLINSSGSNLTFQYNNSLNGFYFRFDDISDREVPVSNLHKRLREGGIGIQNGNLPSGTALVTVIPLAEFCSLEAGGTYNLTVRWSDLMMGTTGYVLDPDSKVKIRNKVKFLQFKGGIKIIKATP